jgi:hypothetical protein
MNFTDACNTVTKTVLFFCAAVLCAIFCVPCTAAGLGDILQKNFAVYNANKGELELLDGGNAADIDGVLQRTKEKRDAVRQGLDENLRFASPASPAVTLTAEHYCKTERAAAKRALQRGSVDQAAEALQYILQLSQQLCSAGQYDCRLAAAKIRLQTLPALQDVLLHPKTAQKHYTELHEILRQQLDRWTKDKDIFAEYKTEGLRVYQVTDAEKQDKNVFERAINVIIDSCELPYYQRQPVLRELKAQMGSEYSVSKDLLKVIPDAMELLALERTQCEMTYLGLSIALGQERIANKTLPPLVPLTGEGYETKLITGGIMITYPGNAKACYVPYR